MPFVISLLAAILLACSTPSRQVERDAKTTTGQSAKREVPVIDAAPVIDAREAAARRLSRDQAIADWGEPSDLDSHLAFLRTIDPATDADCRNPEIIGATVADQVNAFDPSGNVDRQLGCNGTRCRIRITSVGERRIVGLDIFYTRTSDGKATEVDCLLIRGG